MQHDKLSRGEVFSPRWWDDREDAELQIRESIERGEHRMRTHFRCYECKSSHFTKQALIKHQGHLICRECHAEKSTPTVHPNFQAKMDSLLIEREDYLDEDMDAPLDLNTLAQALPETDEQDVSEDRLERQAQAHLETAALHHFEVLFLEWEEEQSGADPGDEYEDYSPEEDEDWLDELRAMSI
jgi:ribosomal protein L37AE/L43A